MPQNESPALPAGKTCRDCRHFKPKCSWFISFTGDETACDWIPSKFIPLPVSDTSERVVAESEATDA